MARRLRAWDVARRFPGTLGITALTLIFFLLEHALGGGTDLRAQLRLGALRPDRVSEHYEVWRLVMPMFLHHGAIHLLLNGIALVQLGPLVESLWGTRRLVVFYVSCGIAGALASAAFTSTGYTAAVGASGAIMGLAGVLLGTTWFGEPSVRAFLADLLGRRLLNGVLFTLVVGFGLWYAIPIVDNWCHVGGLACGILIALAHPDPIDRNESESTVGSLVVIAVVATAITFGAVRGGAVLETLDIDTARMLSARASQEPGTPQSNGVLLEMLEWYDRAGATEEGLDRFARAVEKIRDPSLLSPDDGTLFVTAPPLVGGLMLQAEAGADRDVHITLAIERWLALSPEEPNALNALAWHLVTRTNASLRDPVRAEVLSRESLLRIEDQEEEQGRAERSVFLDTLAECLFQQGRFEEALPIQTEAVALATALELVVLPELEARLEKIRAAGTAG